MIISCNKGGGKAGSNVELKNDDDKTFYSVGAMFGERLGNLSLTEHEINALTAGLRDKALGNKTKVDYQKYQPKVQALFKSRMEKNMAGFKRPKTIIFGDLPKTSTGKIQKFELRTKAKEL